MEGQNKFQNERRRRRIGNAIFGHDKQKVGTIPFPVCVSTSMKHSVMDSISPASQELRGPPRCFKECLICLCSSAWHTSSPLPAPSRVKRRGCETPHVGPSFPSIRLPPIDGPPPLLLLLEKCTSIFGFVIFNWSDPPGESPQGGRVHVKKTERASVRRERARKKCKKISHTLREVILSGVKGACWLPRIAITFPQTPLMSLVSSESGLVGLPSSTFGPSCGLAALSLHRPPL